MNKNLKCFFEKRKRIQSNRYKDIFQGSDITIVECDQFLLSSIIGFYKGNPTISESQKSSEIERYPGQKIRC